MQGPLLIYQLLVLAVLLALLALIAINLRVLPVLLRYGRIRVEEAQPMVAVLVPARNEEANIEECLTSLLAQDYPNYDVWVYDDASTDRTLQIATRMAEAQKAKRKIIPLGEARGQNPELNIVAGTEEVPAGWLGKAYACHRLYRAMRERYNPEYVLFTDADVRHEPRALWHAMGAARAMEAGLLSVFPQQRTVTWAERL